MNRQKRTKKEESIESEISSLRRQIAALPSGKLICTRNQNRYKWYLSDGHSQIYLPKAQRAIAEQLARKKYLSCRLHDLQHERYAISLYLRHYHSNFFQTEKLLTEPSGFQELLAPYFKALPQDLLDWSNAPYEHNTKYPEQLTHKTLSGHYVRSKSEALIDLFLYTNHIPFRYECALPLGNGIIYPDFTIRHPTPAISSIGNILV